MKYAAAGSGNVVDDWPEAAREGGCEPPNPVQGQHRNWLVDAYVTVGGEDVKVSGSWASELPVEARKELLRDLGLPIKKQLMHGEVSAPGRERVADFKVDQVWDGWCSLLLRSEDGSTFDLPIHSDYLGQMNRSAGYVVFDLETTGLDVDACQIVEIAAIRVVAGETVHRFSSLVHIDGKMPSAASAENHINDSDLEGAPHVREVMEGFLEFIGDDSTLVGHNIEGFDIPIVSRVARECGLEFSYAKSEDTVALARRAWPELANHKMDTLRQALRIAGDGAHRALKDCEDEKMVYERAKKELSDHPERREARQEKRKSSARPGAVFSSKWKSKKAKDFVPRSASFDESSPAYGKLFAFTNGSAEETEAAMQAVCDLGGVPKDSVTLKTDYLVAFKDGETGKVKKARENQAKGRPIRIIDADEFKRIVGWEE